jgi:FtsH-binding integral membrane protein
VTLTRHLLFYIKMENDDPKITIPATVPEAVEARTKKFTHAGYGFLGLNIVYLAVAMVLIPPFNFGLSAILSLVAFVLLVGILTYYILKEKKRLAQILAIIFGLRSAFTVYSLTAGDTFQAVPYFLPCLIITFYLLGRAGWNWP